MLSFTELSKKIEISIGLLIFLISLSGISAIAYMELATLEDRIDNELKVLEERMDKRYKRQQDEILHLQNNVNKNEERYIEELERDKEELIKIKNYKVVDD